MKTLPCLSCSLFFILLCLSVQAQLEVIEDFFDFDKFAMDVTVYNTGDQAVYIEDVGVSFQWLKINSGMSGGGGSEKVVKPVDEIQITIPARGKDTIFSARKIKILCPPNQKVRFLVLLDTDFEELRYYAYAELGFRGILKTNAKQVLTTRKRSFDALVLDHQAIKNDPYYRSRKREIQPIDTFYGEAKDNKALLHFYDSLLSTSNQTNEYIALDGIRKTGLSELAPRLEELLLKTKSPVRLEEYIYTLKYLDASMADILMKKLRKSSSSNAEVQGIIALELGKAKAYQAKEQIVHLLGQSHKDTTVYEKYTIAYQLLKDTTDNQALYELIEKNRHWASSESYNEQFQFSRLLQLALYSDAPNLFAPLIKTILTESQLSDLVVRHLFLNLKLIANSNDETLRKTYTNKRKLYDGARLIITDPLKWVALMPDRVNFKNKIYLNFILDPHYHYSPMLYGKADPSWMPLLKDLYPLFFECKSSDIRYDALAHAGAVSDGDGLDAILEPALQDSVQKIRYLAAQLIQEHSKYQFKSLLADNLRHYNKYPVEEEGFISYEVMKELGIYCQMLEADCISCLADMINANYRSDNEALKKVLYFIKFDFIENYGASTAQAFAPAFLQLVNHNPNEKIRKYALEIIPLLYDEGDTSLEPFIKRGIEDESSLVRRAAEKMLLAGFPKGLEKTAIKNLRSASLDTDYHADDSIERYYQYLGSRAYPTILELLLDDSTPEKRIDSHIESIKTQVPKEDWKRLEKGLEYQFKTVNTSYSYTKVDAFSMLYEIKKRQEFLPLLKTALRDDNALLRIEAVQIASKDGIRNLDDLVVANLQDKAYVSEEEVGACIEYLGSASVPLLYHIWKDTTKDDRVKKSYISAWCSKADLIGFPHFTEILEYYLYHERPYHHKFALQTLLPLETNQKRKFAYLESALKSEHSFVRATALQLAIKDEVEGLDTLALHILMDRESYEEDKKYSITYLKNEAIPALKDLLATAKGDEALQFYMEKIIQHFEYLDFKRLKPAIDHLSTSFTRENKTILLLQCLTHLQENDIAKAESLMLKYPDLIKEVELNAYTIPILKITERLKKEVLAKAPKEGRSYYWSTSYYYKSLAEQYILKGAFKNAEEAAQIGLALSPEDASITALHFSAILFQGRYEEAKALFLQYKNYEIKNSYNKKRKQLFRDEFLKAFTNLKAKGFLHPDIERIRGLLIDN